MEKFFKNPMYQGIMIFSILVIVALWVWDDHKNSKKNFYGMLNPSAPAV